MLKVSVPAFGSDAVGVKLYSEPTLTAVAGCPEIVGPLALDTVMVKAGSEACCVPLLTLITIFEFVPTWLALGVPESAPVEELKLAQAGWFCTEKVNAVPLGALVVGWKL